MSVSCPPVTHSSLTVPRPVAHSWQLAEDGVGVRPSRQAPERRAQASPGLERHSYIRVWSGGSERPHHCCSRSTCVRWGCQVLAGGRPRGQMEKAWAEGQPNTAHQGAHCGTRGRRGERQPGKGKLQRPQSLCTPRSPRCPPWGEGGNRPLVPLTSVRPGSCPLAEARTRSW